METCLNCKQQFKAKRKNQRFCHPMCKDQYHNREKTDGIRLTEIIRDQLQSLADAHNISINEMACKILHQAMNPDGHPLEDQEVFGGTK